MSQYVPPDSRCKAGTSALHRQALETKTRVLGAHHPETLSSLYNLAIVFTAQGRLDEAESLHREVLEVREQTLGPDNPQTLDALCAVAGVAALRGDRETALRRLEDAIGRGYSEADSLAADDDFESLYDDPVFVDLVERARRNASAPRDS